VKNHIVLIYIIGVCASTVFFMCTRDAIIRLAARAGAELAPSPPALHEHIPHEWSATVDDRLDRLEKQLHTCDAGCP